MPIYEYGCDKCGTEFEEANTIANRNIVICPKCGAMHPFVQQWFMTPRNTMPDMPEYFDRGMGDDTGQGVHIRGRVQRREEMRKRGLTEAGDSSEVKKYKELLAEHAERKRSRSKER